MKLNPFEFIIVNNPVRRFIQSQIEIKGFLGIPNYVEDGRVLESRLIKILTDHPYESMYKLHDFFDYFDRLGFKVLKKQVYKPLGLTSRFVFIGIKK